MIVPPTGQFGTPNLKLSYKLFWIFALYFGLLVPLVGYGILPWLGLEQFDEVFSLNHFLVLILLASGMVLYALYLAYVFQRPTLFLYFFMVVWPLVECGNELLLTEMGINLHLRPLLILFLGVPAVWYTLRHWLDLHLAIPHFKYFMAFCAWVLLYFLFNNSHATNLLGVRESALFGDSIGMIQFTAYAFCFIGIVLTAVTLLKHRSPKACFDVLNKVLLVTTTLLSILTIVGYPFHLFSQDLDGFHRARGIFSHPNPFSHHMGLLLLYFLGLFCYYQGPYQWRMPSGLLLSAIALNIIAFLLGLSKTGIAAFGLCTLLLLVLNLSSPWMRRRVLNIFLFLLILVPLGLWGFEVASGQSFFDLIQARVDQTNSMVWRHQVWDALMANIDAESLLLGHGFTAANALLLQLTYNTKTNAAPLIMVHNGYLALLYDLGILGLLLFMGVISLMFNTLMRLARPGQVLIRPLLSTILALSIYFLVVCGFDEMTYMFDAAVLFWVFTTMLFCIALREKPL
jgi:O-antigen ligase